MINMLDSLRRDVRFTGRLLAARPGWTAAAILCLANGTGANSVEITERRKEFERARKEALAPKQMQQPNAINGSTLAARRPGK